MGLLSWIVVGAIAGWLAGKLVKGEGFGCLGNIIVGVVGGLLGGFLASVLFNMPDAVNGFNLTSIIVAFLGAVLVVVVIRLLRGGRN
ncbi:MAG: GlsB/YeaQ/YmgE family stress response membrane protein [Chloroflexi bacterium]|nr:GlsB/YeaQ/YmgE family stress response membrane protein [Chloroflexota bacterium]